VGTGSDRERDDFSLEAEAQVLRDVAEHLSFRRFAVMGPSRGGPVAAAFALREPRRVTHLILYGTGAGPLRDGKTWPHNASEQHDAEGLLSELRTPTLVLCRRGDPFVSPETARRLASAIKGAKLELLDGEAHLYPVGDVAAIADRINAITAGAVGGGRSAQLSPPARLKFCAWWLRGLEYRGSLPYLPTVINERDAVILNQDGGLQEAWAWARLFC